MRRVTELGKPIREVRAADWDQLPTTNREALMTSRRARAATLVMVGLVGGSAAPASAQDRAGAFGLVSAQKGSSRRFEVASVKHRPGMYPSYEVSGTKFAATGHTTRMLIATAYGVNLRYVLGPDWINETRFDIQAVLPANATGTQVPELLKDLLATRFGLSLSAEMRTRNVYVLRRLEEGLGPRLQMVTRDCQKVDATNIAMCSLGYTSNSVISRGRTWADINLAGNTIAGVFRDIVIDETALSGQVDLEFAWEAPAAGSVTPEFDQVNAVMRALREQLGLTVERDRRHVEVLIVNKISMPTPD